MNLSREEFEFVYQSLHLASSIERDPNTSQESREAAKKVVCRCLAILNAEAGYICEWLLDEPKPEPQCVEDPQVQWGTCPVESPARTPFQFHVEVKKPSTPASPVTGESRTESSGLAGLGMAPCGFMAKADWLYG